MKVIRTVTALMICISFLNSCKKKSNDPEPAAATNNTTTTPTLNGSMTCTFNGTSWVSTKNTGALVIDTDNDISALVLNGETAAGIIALGIDFPTASTNLTVDTHDFGLTKDDALITYTKKTSGGGTVVEHHPDEATLNITAVDNVNKKVSGTFTCIMHKVGSTLSADSIKITSGVFTNINYVVQ